MSSSQGKLIIYVKKTGKYNPYWEERNKRNYLGEKSHVIFNRKNISKY
jgi:hypothetical protein